MKKELTLICLDWLRETEVYNEQSQLDRTHGLTGDTPFSREKCCFTHNSKWSHSAFQEQSRWQKNRNDMSRLGQMARRGNRETKQQTELSTQMSGPAGGKIQTSLHIKRRYTVAYINCSIVSWSQLLLNKQHRKIGKVSNKRWWTKYKFSLQLFRYPMDIETVRWKIIIRAKKIMAEMGALPGPGNRSAYYRHKMGKLPLCNTGNTTNVCNN